MTHFYILEGIISELNNNEKLRFNYTDSNSTSFDNLFDDVTSVDGFERGIATFSCRERMIDTLCAIEEEKPTKKLKYSAGIRCFGEMFSKHAYKYLKKPKSAKLVSEFIKNVFKLNVSVGYGIESKNVPVSPVVTCADRTKINDGYVTLYFNPAEFNFEGSAVFFSAILALFREQRIYSNIVNGKINSLETLVLELIDISYDRAFRKDFTYDYWGLVYTNGVSLSEIKSKILDNLSDDGNGEGSDWYSIMLLAMYFITNTFLNSSDGYSGPCDYAQNEVTDTDLKKLHKLCGDKFLVLLRINNAEDNFFHRLIGSG